jgi:iron complex outermembrane receptor protein
VPITKANANRPGEPKNVVSATATYAFDNGIAFTATSPMWTRFS